MVVLIMYYWLTDKEFPGVDIFRIWFPGDSYHATCLGTWDCIPTCFGPNEPF